MTSQGGGPSAGEPAELLVGDLMLVRTFRLASDGLLYPVFTSAPWRAGTITAFCKKGLPHTAPAAACSCGFYAYSDPAYLGEQPPWRQVAAVVAFTGTVEISTRGARAEHARMVALYLGPRVTAELERAVAGNYPGVAVYRDRAQMLAEHPLTGQPAFPAPRYDVRTRARGRLMLRAYAAAAFCGGLLPPVIGLTTPVGAVVWVGLVLGGVGVLMASRVDRSPPVALVGLLGLCWLLPSSSGMAAFGHLQAVAMGGAAFGFWRAKGRAGMRPPHPEPSRWRPAT